MTADLRPRPEPWRTEPLLVGSTLFPAHRAARLLRGWRDHTRAAPATITTSFRLLRLPAQRDLPAGLRGHLVVCVDGVSVDAGAAQRLDARLRYLSDPLGGGWSPVSRARAIAVGDDDTERAIGDGLWLGNLDDWVIEAFLGQARGCWALRCAELRHRGGTSDYLFHAAGVPGPRASRRVVDAHLDRMLTALRIWSIQPKVIRVGPCPDHFADRLPDGVLARLGRDREVPLPELVLVDS